MKKILVLSASKIENSVEAFNNFIDKVNKQADGEFECIPAHFDDLIFRFGVSVDVFVSSTNSSVKEYDFIYIKTFHGYFEESIALAHVLKYYSIQFICRELISGFAHTKLAEYSILSTNNIPIPESIFVSNNKLDTAFDFFVDSLGLPFVFKAIDGLKGRNNYRISSLEEYINAINENPSLQFIAQKYIKNEGDSRIVILDGRAGLIFFRKKTSDDTHINSPSRGSITSIQSPEEIGLTNVNIALKAAKILGRDVAGVDLVIENITKEPYIFEVNDSPQIGSGSYVDQKIKLFSDFFKTV